MTRRADRHVEVRARRDDDLDACARIGLEVHRRDGYPLYLPDGDFRVLLIAPPAIAAFVAVSDHDVVGHVAIHEARPGAAVDLASHLLGIAPGGLAVVARLFSSPDRRRAGIGRALLGAAADAARERGLVPVLDVSVELRPAIALYERCGWTNLGAVSVSVPDGRVLTELVFVAP